MMQLHCNFVVAVDFTLGSVCQILLLASCCSSHMSVNQLCVSTFNAVGEGCSLMTLLTSYEIDGIIIIIIRSVNAKEEQDDPSSG